MATLRVVQAERPHHELVGRVLSFDLASEARQLEAERPWRQRSHNAKTLIKHDDLCVVLIALGRGERMAVHEIERRAVVLALTGDLRLHLPDQSIDLRQGRLVGLDRNVRHELEAASDALVLLTLGGPPA